MLGIIVMTKSTLMQINEFGMTADGAWVELMKLVSSGRKTMTVGLCEMCVVKTKMFAEGFAGCEGIGV